MLWWSYILFTGSPNCEAHGVKMAALILPICIALGNKVAALVPLVIGILFLVINIIAVKSKI